MVGSAHGKPEQPPSTLADGDVLGEFEFGDPVVGDLELGNAVEGDIEVGVPVDDDFAVGDLDEVFGDAVTGELVRRLGALVAMLGELVFATLGELVFATLPQSVDVQVD